MITCSQYILTESGQLSSFYRYSMQIRSEGREIFNNLYNSDNHFRTI